jgi:AcrR family transcriptional regulator
MIVGVAERRARERAARRRAILDATRELVREHGFAGTTTRQIAERCELSEATLFFYFSSKDEILLSLLGQACDFWAEGLDAILTVDASPAERLEAVWRFFGEVQEEHPEYVHVSTYLAHPGATRSVDPDVLTDLTKRTGDNFRRLADLMAELGGVVNPRVAADVLWSAFLGMMVLRQGRANLGAPEHPDQAELDEALDLLVSGMAPRDAAS